MNKNNFDIIFIVPAFSSQIKEESIGTLILAKKAQLNGLKVKIIRYWESEKSPKDDYSGFRDSLIQLILAERSHIVSFYCRCEEYHICLDISKKLKERCPDLKISFGGPQAELVAKETMSTFPHVDYICCSEGENTIVPFINFALGKDYKAENIDGLYYRDANGNIKNNNLPAFLDDDFIRSFRYYDLIPDDIIREAKSMPIDVGRGCPFSCTYCSTKTFWKRKFRLRNLDDIIDEMQWLYETYGISNFDFMHDLFTVNKRRVIQFCNKLKERNLKLKWGCDSRIDTIDEEMIDKMIDSGLSNIFFGIETGSERMQSLIQKRLNLSKCEEIISFCLKKGLTVTTSFIYGFPGENEFDVSETLKTIVKFQNMGCNVLTNLCHIMNGTALFDSHKEDLIINLTTAYNKCIPAFNDLFPMIESHKTMFANFCDFPNALREELKYLDAFRYTLTYAYNHLPKLYSELLLNDYASINMYRVFCLVNQDIFNKYVPSSNGDVTSIRKTFKHQMPSDVYETMISNLVNFYSHE